MTDSIDEIDKKTPNEKSIVVVRNPIERFFYQFYIIIIPGIYAIYAILDYLIEGFPTVLLDFHKILTQLLLIVSLLLSNRMFKSIANTVPRLFYGGIITFPREKQKINKSNVNIFISGFDNLLNSPLRIVFGIVFSLFAFMYYYVRTGGMRIIVKYAGITLEYLLELLYIFPTVVYAYFVGIVVWKMIVNTGMLLYSAKRLNIQMRIYHPDNASGILPVGLLCMDMLYVAAVPTIRSAITIITPYVRQFADIPQYIFANANFALFYIFAPALLFAGIIGIIISLLPIFAFHNIMLKHKMQQSGYLDKISERIISVKTNLLQSIIESDFESVDKKNNEISELETLYKKYYNINTWPIDRKALIRIWGTVTLLVGQILALWNLIS